MNYFNNEDITDDVTSSFRLRFSIHLPTYLNKYNSLLHILYNFQGPKAFQRHFAEWRHAHGMRCLGIPNTAHFANVTQIEDAMALWDKLKVQKQEEAWKPEVVGCFLFK